MFARCKLKFDPLFNDLPDILKHREKIDAILDIGCGYGVPACWCLENFPEAQVIGIDPDPERIRVAARVTGERGMMAEGAAPDLPDLPNPVDLILLLDMLHYLDDQQVMTTLERSYQLLAAGGVLVIRVVIIPPGRRSFYWYIEDLRVKLAGIRPCYRTLSDLIALMEKSGFTILATPPTGNKELVWAVGQADKKNTEGL
jgi:cyclopropane fatty-acyl-phospholipid synthase-like methyltransferase